MEKCLIFRLLCNAPSGWYYKLLGLWLIKGRSEQGDSYFAWFASKTGNKGFFEGRPFFKVRPPTKNWGKLGRKCWSKDWYGFPNLRKKRTKNFPLGLER